MFEKILVSLDGSQLAEVALSYVEELAGRLGSEIVLLNVCRPERQSFQHMHELYLNEMAETIRREVKKKYPRCKECQVSSEVLPGDPAEVISNYAEENDIKLVVMSTHGNSGLKLWVLGSVVDKVIRTVNIPTLVIRSEKGEPVKTRRGLINRLLLPLDCSEAGKISIPYAADLAKRLKASIVLLGVKTNEPMIPTTPNITSIRTFKQMQKAEDKRVREFISEVERELRADGIPVKHAIISGENAAAEIIEQGQKVEADLIVMAIRARSPIARWFIGSVSEQVLLEGDLPLLTIRKEPK